MPINLWVQAPLNENESLKESSIPTVTPIDKLLDAGNCGRVIDRGEEACDALTRLLARDAYRQSCEGTDRNCCTRSLRRSQMFLLAAVEMG